MSKKYHSYRFLHFECTRTASDDQRTATDNIILWQKFIKKASNYLERNVWHEATKLKYFILCLSITLLLQFHVKFTQSVFLLSIFIIMIPYFFLKIFIYIFYVISILFIMDLSLSVSVTLLSSLVHTFTFAVRSVLNLC